VFFPLREKRIESLLKIARLRNYEVDHAWFDAMDSFGDEGLEAVKKAAFFDWLSTTKPYYATHIEPAPSEPGMLKVMDKWVSCRYELEKVKNEQRCMGSFPKNLSGGGCSTILF